MKLKFLALFPVVVLVACGGGGGGGGTDVETERLVLTGSVEDATENSTSEVLAAASVIFQTYVQTYPDASPGELSFTQVGNATLNFTARFTYEKQSATVYNIDLIIDSLTMTNRSGFAFAGDIIYSDYISNSTPFAGHLWGTYDMEQQTVNFTMTGAGENYTVTGDKTGSVNSFDMDSTITGDAAMLIPACTTNSKMTLPLSNGETVTCTLSADCQTCNL